MKLKRFAKLRRRCCCGCSAWAAFIVILSCLAAGRLLGPVSVSPRKVTRVTVPAGSSSSKIADLLAEKGLIRSPSLFLLYARLRGDAGRLKSGTFRLSTDMNAAQIIERLARGVTGIEDLFVTVPEGYRVTQISQTMASRGVTTGPDSLKDVAEGLTDGFNASFPLPRRGLEGYLFPNTYRFLPDSTPEKVIQAMLDTFQREFYDPNAAEIERSGYSLHDLVTIASMVEREARVPEDRARIAGVIVNRTKRKMRLEIDATVLYALGYHKTRVLYKDLKVDSPYNTYLNSGLPPGPIASPGIASLMAALRPEKHDFLYYVTIKGGAHEFARTREQHDRNVAKLRAARRNAAAAE